MNRKDDHIKYALLQNQTTNDFDEIRFVHNAISDIALSDVNLKTNLCGMDFDYPIFINAMTGGSERAYEINDRLSKLAKYFNIPIASGSVSAAIKDPSKSNSFKVIRKNYPNGIVMANIGADKGLNAAKIATELLDADILQIHLNVVQEMIMPEGDRDFRNLESNISEIINNLSVPVIVKEVGFGMSFEALEKLKRLGVKTVDISGKGGTNFALIENARRDEKFENLNNFGLSTVESLLESIKVKDLEIIASGGVRDAMDVVKSLALGAKAVGMSAFFLKLIINYNFDIVVKKVENLLLEIKAIMTILGKKNVQELKDTNILVSNKLESFMRQRNIPLLVLNKR